MSFSQLCTKYLILMLVGGLIQTAVAFPPDPLVTQEGSQLAYLKGTVNEARPGLFGLIIKDETQYETEGFMRFLSSGHEATIKGAIQGSTFTFREYSTANEVIGYIEGQFTLQAGVKSMDFNWENAERNIARTGTAAAVAQADTPLPPTAQGWVRSYSGRYKEKRLELIIAKDNLVLAGNAFVEVLWKYASTDGSIQKDKKGGELFLETFYLSPIASIRITVDGQEKYAFADEEGNDLKMNLITTLEVETDTYMDHYVEQELSYPYHKSSKASKEYMMGVLERFMLPLRKQSEAERKTPPSPFNHLTVRLVNWWEVDYCSEQLLSGRMIFFHSWGGMYTTVPFNFNLKTGEAFDLKDVFKADQSKFKNELAAYIAKDLELQLNEMRKNFDPSSATYFEKVLKEADFKHHTFTKGGLLVSTDFNTAIGEQVVLVPYDILKPYLKNNHPIAELLP